MIDRRITLLVILFVTSITLMTYQSTRGPVNPGRFLKLPLYTLTGGLSKLWKGLTTPVKEIYKLKEENKNLKEEVKKLLLSNERCTELEKENLRLREILKLEPSPQGSYITARVVAGGARRWPRVIVIDRGERDGVKKDMVVRNTKGLVGKVVEVNAGYSEVLLITDPSFSVSVRLQESRLEGILSGKGDGSCILKYISKKAPVDIGERLVTSGLDGIFPPGIPVAEVTSLEGETELFKKITAMPYIDETSLEEVMLLTKAYPLTSGSGGAKNDHH